MMNNNNEKRVHFSTSEDIHFADAASVDTLDPMDDQETLADKIQRWHLDNSGTDQDSGIGEGDGASPEEGKISEFSG